MGLVGCGLFGECHARVLQRLPTARVEAVFDVDRDRAEAVASQYDIPRVHDTLEAICGDDSLDAISVVTPEELHRDPVVAALSAGKHVFVEKPLATDLAHCREMIEAAKRADRMLMVGHLLRFETRYALLKQEVASGRLGRVVSMHAKRNRPKSLLPRYGRTHPALENCIHDVDLMLWYAGDRVDRVRAFGRKTVNERHHDIFWGVLEFEGGAIGVVETIWLLPDGGGIQLDDAFQVYGDRGVGNVRLVPEAVSFWTEDGYAAPDTGYSPELGGPPRGALADELAHFCDCVSAGRRSDVITPTQAMDAVRVVNALIASSLEERDVVLDWSH
jgi:predicted dehydrogenase